MRARSSMDRASASEAGNVGSTPAERISLYKPLLAKGLFYVHFPYTQKEIIGNEKKRKEYVFLIKNATKNATKNPRVTPGIFALFYKYNNLNPTPKLQSLLCQFPPAWVLAFA